MYLLHSAHLQREITTMRSVVSALVQSHLLAYADTFYVSSRHNGTETYYMIYRNNDNVPHMDQVYQAATDQQNGTTIIVPIKRSYDASDF